jgi:predicted Zn-dependent protease
VRAAIFKKRLGRGNEAALELLFECREKYPDSREVVLFMYPLLCEEGRGPEALEIMEAYVEKFPTDVELNLEIIRMLVLAPGEGTRDPQRAMEYIEWYLQNLGKKNPEIYLLLATAQGQVGYFKEAWQSLDMAESLEPHQGIVQAIESLREEIRKKTQR